MPNVQRPEPTDTPMIERVEALIESGGEVDLRPDGTLILSDSAEEVIKPLTQGTNLGSHY